MQLSIENTNPSRVSVTEMASANQSTAQAVIAPVVIAAVGMDERMLFAISLFFKSRLGERYAFGDPQDADIWLFDVDNMDGRSEWATHRTARPGVPAILVSIEETPVDNAVNAAFALKPLSAALLADTLEQVTCSPTAERVVVPPAQMDTEKEVSKAPSTVVDSFVEPSMPFSAESVAGPSTYMPDSEWYQDPIAAADTPEITSSSARETVGGSEPQRSEPGCSAAAMKLNEKNAKGYIGSTPDIDASDPKQLEKAQFDPDHFLVGAVSGAAAMAIRNQRPVRVSGRHWAIVIRPNPDRAFVDIKHLHLRTLATLPLQEAVTTTVLGQSESGNTFDGVKWRLSTFRWILTLLAARGRVPVGTDMNANVKLMHWPNLTRLEAFPNAMRIASLWSRRPISLLESARVLGIPQRYVFTFYSAVNELEIVETVHTEVSEKPRSDTKPVKRHRGLFRKILAHLRLG